VVEWRDVASSFSPDGALRDIYAFGTSVREWQAVYDAVRAAYPVVLQDSRGLPADVRELLNWKEACPLLTVDPDGLDIACHFFVEQEIEFDFNPTVVRSQAELDDICRFLMLVGQAAGKDAVLTMENCPDWLILRYDVGLGRVIKGA
jgi:hypothetical protein